MKTIKTKTASKDLKAKEQIGEQNLMDTNWVTDDAGEADSNDKMLLAFP